jgi:molybdenum cofactor synthesis domain-containing protein
MLREARMQAGLDIDDVEQRTKIRAKYLRALENEEWALLPGSAFTKGFLRSYADLLGLDPRLLIDEYKRQWEEPHELDVNPVRPTIGPEVRDRGPTRRGRWLVASASVVVIALALVLVGHLFGTSSTSGGDTGSALGSTSTGSTGSTTAAPQSCARTAAAVARRGCVSLRIEPAAAVYVCLVGDSRIRIDGQRLLARGWAVSRARVRADTRERRGDARCRRSAAVAVAERGSGALRDQLEGAGAGGHSEAARLQRMSARAAIVVTGTELLGGRVSDRNGPWLAERLSELGVDLAHITIVGDRGEDMLAALEWCAASGIDLVVTSGGLGPTADDMTAAVVGAFCGREMVLDAELEERIAEILRPLRSRWPNLSEETIRASNRKQAVVPAGAVVLDPAGTAPGLVVAPADGRAGPTVVVLPGPPRELQPLWSAATQTDAFARAVAGRTVYELRMLRLYGLPESQIAETLRAAEAAGVDLGLIEVTTCMRRAEIEVVTRYEEGDADVYEAFAAIVRERHPDTLYSEDGTSVDDQVAAELIAAACRSRWPSPAPAGWSPRA